MNRLVPSYDTVVLHGSRGSSNTIIITNHKYDNNTVFYYDNNNNLIAEYDNYELSYYTDNKFKYKIYYDIIYKDYGKIEINKLK
jgi:hypothetical protein